MEEQKTTCRVCRTEIQFATAERNGGLCAPCHRAANPYQWKIRPEAESRAIEVIRERVLAGCSAEEFAELSCPVCGSRLRIDTHFRPSGAAFVFVACIDDTTHVAFTNSRKYPPAWWAAHRSAGWIIE